MDDLAEIFGTPIAVYTMAQALTDGTLVDAGELTQELFTVPVFLTAAAWADCVAWNADDSDRTGACGQSETGRLWDVLWMTRCSRRPKTHHCSTTVQLYRIGRDHEFTTEPAAELVTLTATIATHDDGTAVIVIGFPEED